LEEENKHLYTLNQSVALDILSCNQLISICNQYIAAATTIEESYQHKIPSALVRATGNDTKILAQMFEYLEKMVQTQFTVLYNRMIQEDTKHTIKISESSMTIAAESKKDSSSMKTVAYLTLTFLPITSVSAIFSTTLFDFQNWHSTEGNSRVVSQGWWVFLITAVIATFATMTIWYFWHKQQSKTVMSDEENSDPVDPTNSRSPTVGLSGSN
jgi:NADH:ubiquinone oxidoreductase subunit H